MTAPGIRFATFSSPQHLPPPWRAVSRVTYAGLGQLREVPEPDEFNLPLADRLAHPLIAQRPQLHLALRSVAGTKSGLYIAGMAGQLGHAIPDLLVQQAKEPFDPDLLEMGIATPLAVELRDMADLGGTPQWHRAAPGPREHLREHPPVMVHVVVRVQVGGEGADELQERRYLPLEIGADSLGRDPAKV